MTGTLDSLLPLGLLLQGRGVDNIIEGIIQILFVAGFILLPILRSLFGDKTKRGGTPPNRPARPGGAPPSSRGPRPMSSTAARDLFERLARGEPVEPVEPVKPQASERVAPAATSTRPTSRVPQQEAPRRRESPRSRVPVEPSVPAQAEARPIGETAGSARSTARARSMSENDIEEHPEWLESQRRRPVEDPGASKAEADDSPPVSASRLRRSRGRRGALSMRPGREELTGPAAWRRAIVLAEVLGPPATMREADSALGPRS